MRRFIVAALLGLTAVGVPRNGSPLRLPENQKNALATAMNLGSGPSASGTVIIGSSDGPLARNAPEASDGRRTKGPDELLSALGTAEGR
jgi:hypothetical protein